jgi:hypothetical protein
MSRVTIRSCAHQHMLAIGQKFRDDSGDMPAMVEDRFGACPHQAGRAAAIDQPDAVFGQDTAESARSLHECRVGAGAGAAINANRLDSIHGLHVAPARDTVKRRRLFAPQ